MKHNGYKRYQIFDAVYPWIPAICLVLVLFFWDYAVTKADLYKLRHDPSTSLSTLFSEVGSSPDVEDEFTYDDGFQDGYRQAQEDGLSLTNVTDISYYYEIEDMDTEEIVDYLNRGQTDTSFCYYSGEFCYTLFSYAYQNGYSDCCSGKWSEDIQQLLNETTFSADDVDTCELFRP